MYIGYIKRFGTWLQLPQTVFLIFSLIFAVWFIFTAAPLSGTDEFTHFPRAYQISEGVFWERRFAPGVYGGYLPAGVNQMINAYRNLSRESWPTPFEQSKQQLNQKYSADRRTGQKLVRAVFSSDAIYPPWALFPAVPGILMARSLKLPLIWYVYLSRLTTLFIWLGLTWAAIKLLPGGKWFLVVTALLPTTLSQASTIGADGLLMGIDWLLIALTLGLMAGKIRPRVWVWLGFALLAAAACLIKESYWLLAGLILVIPAKMFVKRWHAWFWRVGSLALAAAGSLWLADFSSRTIFGPSLTPTYGLNLNPKGQVDYILKHPLLILVRFSTLPFTKSFDSVYQGMVGIVTNRMIYLSILAMTVLAFALFWSLYRTRPLPELVRHRTRLLLTVAPIFLGSYYLIAAAIYSAASGVASPVITGLSGRYFLPLLPLLVAIPLSLKRRFVKNRLATMIPIVLITLFGLVDLVLSVT